MEVEECPENHRRIEPHFNGEDIKYCRCKYTIFNV